MAVPATRTSASTCGSRGSTSSGKAGFIGLGWPVEFGGRGATLDAADDLGRGVHARPGAGARQPHGREPARADAHRATAPPSSRSASCPASCGATSGGARATASPTRAPTSPTSRPAPRLDGDEWVVNGQKVWTSLAHVSHWCFVVARTDPGSDAPPGALVPARADGPARSRGAADRADHRRRRVQRGVLRRRPHRGVALVVGEVDDGWRIAMGLLGFERGVSTLAQQVGFERELDHVLATRTCARSRRRPGRCASVWSTRGSGCGS